MAKKRWLGVVFGVMVLVVGVVGDAGWRRLSAGVSAPVEVWPEYVSGEGYSFRYPPGMQITPSGQQLLGYMADFGRPTMFVYDSDFIKVEKRPEMSFADWYPKYEAYRDQRLKVGGDRITDVRRPVRL